MVKSVYFAPVLFVCGAYGQSTADLERRVGELTARVQFLEQKLNELLAVKTPPPAEPPAAPVAQLAAEPMPQSLTKPESTSPLEAVSVTGDSRSRADAESRLPVAGYMDFHFNKERGLPGEFDFHRFVLLFGHSFSSRLKFWSELEVEHAFIEGGEESGEVALEQAYLDFLLKPQFNLRAGMLLAPVGIVNERHEPPSFNGVERPFVETFIIPTTWREMGFGATGDLGRGFRYRAYLMSGLDASRFTSGEGFGAGKTNGFLASFRNPAKVTRLEYVGLRRLALGASVYSGHTGFNLHSVNPRVDIFDVDGRYSYRRLDFRGLFADTWISRAGELNRALQLETGSNPNIASRMRGAYLESAVHLLPRQNRNDLILFARREAWNTQRRMPEGYVPLPQFDRTSWVLGATYKPHADIAVKFDYGFNSSARSVFRPADTINFGIGWWF